MRDILLITVFLLLSILIFSFQSSAQYPSLTSKQFSLGGDNDDFDEFTRNVFQDKNKDIVIVSATKSSNGDIRQAHGSKDLWVVKIDGFTGDTAWISRAIGGLGNEEFNSSLRMPRLSFESYDGNYVIAMHTNSSDGDIRGQHGQRDLWVVKLNSLTGDTIWTSRAFGGSNDDKVAVAIETKDKNIVITGTSRSTDGDVNGLPFTSSNIWAIKLDGSTGNEIWISDAIGGTGGESVYSMFEDIGGNIVLGAITSSTDVGRGTNHGGGDLWFVKLNGLNGDTIWTSAAIGGSSYEENKTIFSAADGHYISAGFTTSEDGDVTGFHTSTNILKDDLWLVKINQFNGNLIWTSRAFGGTRHETIADAWLDSFGNYVLVGTTSSFDGDVFGYHFGGSSTFNLSDYWIIIVDSGTKAITYSVAIGGKEEDELYNITTTCDGGYLFSGDTYNMTPSGDVTQASPTNSTESLWMVKTNALFQVEWDRVFSDSDHAEFGSAFETHGGYIMIGRSASNIGGDKTVPGHGGIGGDIWTSKIEWIQADFISDTVCPNGNPNTFLNQTKGLATAIPGVIWQWDFGDGSNDTSKNTNHSYLGEGVYEVTLAVQKDCQFDTFTSFAIVTLPSLFLGEDTNLCENFVELNASIPKGNSYTWSTGESSASIIINQPGLYWVITDSPCNVTDTILVDSCLIPIPTIDIPNSFTPNNDGLNDVFLIFNSGLKELEYFKIYNRWGQIVYYGNSLEEGWDGTFNGKLQEIGTYYYELRTISFDDKVITKMGTIALIR